MGHRTTKVAMRYQHPSPDHKLHAVKSLDKGFSELKGNKIVHLNG